MTLPFKQVQLRPLTPVELEGLEQLQQKYEEELGVLFMDWFRLHHIPRLLHEKLDRTPETIALMRQTALTLLQEAQFIDSLFDLQIPGLSNALPRANPQPETQTTLAQGASLPDSAHVQFDSASAASSESSYETDGSVGARAIEWNVD